MDKIIRVKNRSADAVSWKILQPFQGDLKEISKPNFEKLKRSVIKHGITKAADVWISPDGDYKCLDGHQRLKLYEWLEKKGYTVPLIPIAFVEADSESEAKEILLTHAGGSYGTITEQGLMDYMKGADLDLDFLNEQIVVPEIDMEAFEEKFKTTTVREHERGKGEDDVPEVRKDPQTKLGDIWALGRHRLMCGNSVESSSLDKLLNGRKADMVFTDPPYGIGAVGSNGKIGADNLAKNGIYPTIIGDQTTETAKSAYNLSVEMKIPVLIFWGGNYYSEFCPPNSGWIVWDKRGDMASNNFADCELAWTNTNKPARCYKQLWSGMIKEGESSKRVHPTQKPIALAQWCFENYGEPSNVLDLFGGSGSTLIACEKTDRQCFMMELEPHYVRVIIDRWEAFTGQKAKLIS